MSDVVPGRVLTIYAALSKDSTLTRFDSTNLKLPIGMRLSITF